MKAIKVGLLVLFLCASMMAFGDTVVVQDDFNRSALVGWSAVGGSWKIMSGRVVQTDTRETIAMLTGPAPQSGTIQYEFEVEYIAGAEDGYAGFGIHIGTSSPSMNRSWGNGRSMLLWVTFDPDVYGWPGAFLQAYNSSGPTEMDLYPSGDIVKDGGKYPVSETLLLWVADNVELIKTVSIPLKLRINFDTGEGRIYDFFNPDSYYYPFSLGGRLSSGSYATIRTNSLSVAIDNVKVTKID